MLEATRQNAAGRYDLALEPWQEALRLDASYENAYRGIGKAYMSAGRYEEAMPYLRRGGDRENYSKAFKVVRGGFMQAWFYPLLAGAALLLAAVVLRRRIWRAVTRGKTLPVLLPAEERPTYPMRHLITGFDGCAVQRPPRPGGFRRPGGAVVLLLAVYAAVYRLYL